MSKIPAITARKAIRAFGKAGFVIDRKKGSHTILVKAGHPYHLSVPEHKGKILPKGLLRSLVRDAGLTVEEFSSFL